MAVLSHIHGQEVFSDVPVFPITLIVSGFVTTEKNLFLSSLHPLFSFLAKLVTLLLSLVSTRLKSPRCSSFLSLARCSSFLNILVSLFRNLSNTPLSLLHHRAQNRTQYSRCGLSSAKQRDWITSVDLLAICCLMQPRIPVTFAVRAHHWLMFSQEPQGIFCTVAFQVGVPQQILVCVAVPPQVQDFALLFAEVHGSLSSHPSSLSTSLHGSTTL